MADYTGEIIEAQADWLTVSAHGESAAERMLDYARSLEPRQRELGNRRRSWKLMGYEGVHCGAVEYGSRDKASAMVRLIGDLADVELVRALSVAHQATRLDLAVTWRPRPADPYIGSNAYSQADMWYAVHPRSSMPSRVQDAAGGSTTYVGKRGSENMLRIYHKGAEALARGSREEAERYADCWRYELETKGSVPLALAERLAIAEDRVSFVQNYVHTWTEQHGIVPAFPARGAVAIQPGFRRRSDSDSKLRHLAKNVKPTLDWFRSEGKLDAARKALGLD